MLLLGLPKLLIDRSESKLSVSNLLTVRYIVVDDEEN
jgi:hypothetical protein